MPSSRAAAGLAWAIGIAGIVVVVAALLLWAGRGFGTLPVSFGHSVLGVIGLVIAPLTYLTFGALLAARLPRNPIGWMLLACGVLTALMLPTNLLVTLTHESLKPPDAVVLGAAWLRNTFATPGVAVLLTITVFLFPEGRPLTPRWSVGIGIAALGGALLMLGAALNPEGLVEYPTLPNPTAAPVGLTPLVNALQVTAVTLMCVAVVHAVASLAARYRAGDHVRRAQLRWILLATMLTAFAALPFLLTRYLVDVGDTLGDVAALGIQLAMATFPIAAAAAISRYRLYDVDLLIGRTLVYVPLMAILGGLYTASSAIFQRIFVAFTGETSDVAIVLTALVVASAFTPLRRALEGMLERRFPTISSSTARVEMDVDQHQPAAPSAAPAQPVTTVPLAQLHAISDDDLVDCPVLGSPVHLSHCLECNLLRAITTAPTRAVVCTGVAPTTH
jgi:hypothetical protein